MFQLREWDCRMRESGGGARACGLWEKKLEQRSQALEP